MKIINAVWTSQRNKLLIQCDVCGHEFFHPADRWSVACVRCRKNEHLSDIRARYMTGGSYIADHDH